MVGRLRWQRIVDRALLGPSARALECGPALRDRFCASSLLEVVPEASFGKAAARRGGPHSRALHADTCRHYLSP